MIKFKYFLCWVFGHIWDKVNPNDLSYHCERCDRLYRGILPRGKFKKYKKELTVEIIRKTRIL